MSHDWDINTALKISIMTEPHCQVCPLTNKQDKQEGSICKAKGATSQILVANALKYFFAHHSYIWKVGHADLEQQNWRWTLSYISGQMATEYSQNYVHWTSLANIYRDNLWHKYLLMSCLGSLLSKVSQF